MNQDIKLIENESLWNNFIFEYSPQALFQTWQWGEVQRLSDAKLFRYGYFENGVLIGIFQVVKVVARRGSFLHVRHGPIFNNLTPKNLQYCTDYLKKLCLKENVWYLRLSPLIDANNENKEVFNNLGFKSAAIHAMDAENCWILPLASTEEEILSAMRKTTRYEIKKADKIGVVVKSATKIQDLDHFFKLYEETAKRHSFIGHKGIKEEFEIFFNRDEIKLYFAYHENKLIAAAIILFVGNQAIYHHGASISNAIPGSYKIQWEAIKEAKKRGKDFYNFWGIAPGNKKNHPWSGITLFKKGFGGFEKEYLHAQDLPVSPGYWFSRSIETWRRLKKGY